MTSSAFLKGLRYEIKDILVVTIQLNGKHEAVNDDVFVLLLIAIQERFIP